MTSEDHFNRLVIDHYDSLYRFAIRLTQCESDACDLTQQTYYAWASKGHQLRDADKVKSWLFTTMHHGFLLSRRQQWRFSNDDFNEATAALEAEPEKPSDWPAARSALADLDELFRAPVALYYLEDLSYTEIAKTLRTPLGTVKSRIARGLSQLRTILLTTNLPSSDIGTEISPVACMNRDLSRTAGREPITAV